MSQPSNSPAELQVTERDNTLNPRQLRSAGFIPATLYGKNIESQSIQVREVDFVRLYGHGHKEFKLNGLPGNIIARAHQVQIKPVSEEVLAIEFLQLSPLPGTPEKSPKAEQQTVLTGA